MACRDPSGKEGVEVANRVIEIDPITRLEGHGKINIFLDDQGDVDKAVLQIPELRGFEAFCVGRPAEEMPVGWLQVARCAASSAWCRLQLARDEMRSGGGLVGAANVLFQGSSDDPEGVRGSMMAGGGMGPEGDFQLGGMHRLETRTRATGRDDDLNEMFASWAQWTSSPATHRRAFLDQNDF